MKYNCLYIIQNNIYAFLFVSVVLFKQNDRINKTLKIEVSSLNNDFVRF